MLLVCMEMPVENALLTMGLDFFQCLSPHCRGSL